MPTALIIGISGQDGAYLSRLLLERGYTVIGASRALESSKLERLLRLGVIERVRLVALNPQDFGQVQSIIEHFAPDEIYNLSGQSSVGISYSKPAETFDSIAVASRNIVEALRLSPRRIKLFNAGSGECFGRCDAPAGEDAPFHPVSPYGAAKAAAHWTIANYRAAYDLPICTGILFNHESPLRPPAFVTRKIIDGAVRIAQEHGGELSLGNLDIIRDWGWAPEYMDAAWRMLRLDEPQDLVLATGSPHSLADFLEVAFRTVGLNWHNHVKADPTLMRPSDIPYSCGDPSRARRIIGWQAETGFEHMVQMLVEDRLSRVACG